MSKMYFHWKSLLGFGFVFWIVLCLSDIFSGKPRYHLEEDYGRFSGKDWEELYGDTVDGFTGKVLKFGWSIFIWNTMTFLLSVIICSFSKTFMWMLLKLFLNHRYIGLTWTEKRHIPLNHRSESSSLSKIPVKIKSTFNSDRSSDTNVEIKRKFSNKEVSCPNLLSSETSNNLPKDAKPPCHTLYQNDKVFPIVDQQSKCVQLESQCAKLREEMSRIQASSLKDQAAMSRRLETAAIERKELAKKVTVLQKENKAAKQQLEELFQEKAVLGKRLEVANKELKCGIKGKKLALQKLEEAMSDVANLRTQMQQVSRDKEILEGKLKLLESEYENLKERVFTTNQRNLDTFQMHTPERDTDSMESSRLSARREEPAQNQETNMDQESQTDLDMRKIQTKIQQLEKNLQNFNSTKTEITFSRTGCVGGSEGSISGRDINIDNPMRSSDETDFSDTTATPRLRFWAVKPTDMIQALGYRIHDKVHLDNIRESKSERVKLESELDEYSSGESLDDMRPPQRIVSSSRAFQNFLKCLPVYDNRKRSFSSHSDLNF